MRKQKSCKRKVFVAICLTKTQKDALKQLIKEWDIDMALVGRRLVQHLISNKTTLWELLKKYHAAYPVSLSKNKELNELRTCKVCIRISWEEKQKLNQLAEEGFYLPGETARILMELFIAGIIKKSDIWE